MEVLVIMVCLQKIGNTSPNNSTDIVKMKRKTFQVILLRQKATRNFEISQEPLKANILSKPLANILIVAVTND